MKQVFAVVMSFLLVVLHAPAQVVVPAGANQAAVQTLLKSAAPGSTVVFPQATGPITSTITIPCGVSLSGPTVPYSQTPNQAATINAGPGFIGWGFQTTPGCSQSQTIQYLAWNGGLPSNGGGFLNIVPGTTNLTVQNNWLHGVNAPGAATGGFNNQADLIFLSGGNGNPATSNVLIRWNVFGSTSFADCATAMNDKSGAEDDNGGGCGGVGIHNNVTNVALTNNIFHWLEEPIKTFESPSSGSCNGLTVNYNSVTNYSRIGYETQCYTPGPVLMFIQYNNWGTRYGSLQTYDISAANGCGNAYGTNCETHTDYNLVLQATTGAADVGLEIWGLGGSGCTTHCTTANYNLLQGYLFNAITWSKAGNFQFNNNTFNVVSNSGNNTNCAAGAGGFWNKETGNSPAYTPTCNGNTFSNAITGTTSSVAPTIAPAGGSFNGSQVVTFINPGQNRDTNTGIWYTTDGSSPTPGAGTAQYIAGGGAITVSSTTTVKAVGMWGAQNQPVSYPTGFGYVPSNVVSATYTSSGGPVAPPVTPPIVPPVAPPIVPPVTPPAPTATLLDAYLGTPNNVNTMLVGDALQFHAVGDYSSGTTPATIPNSQVTWSTSNPKILTVSSTGKVTAVGPGQAFVKIAIGAVANEWGIVVSPAPITKYPVKNLAPGTYTVTVSPTGAVTVSQ